MKKLTMILSLIVYGYTHAQTSEFACHTPQRDTLYLEKGNEMTQMTLAIWESTEEKKRPVIRVVDKTTLENHRKRLYPKGNPRGNSKG